MLQLLSSYTTVKILRATTKMQPKNKFIKYQIKKKHDNFLSVPVRCVLHVVEVCMLNELYIMNTQRGIVVTGQFQLSLRLHRDYAETLLGLTFYKLMNGF